MKKEIKYKLHATGRATLRGIDKELVREAIQRGSKRKQGHKTIASYQYFEVVYIETRNVLWVVTIKPRNNN